MGVSGVLVFHKHILFRNNIKSHMKIHFLASTCSKHMYSSNGIYTLDNLFYKKK